MVSGPVIRQYFHAVTTWKPQAEPSSSFGLDAKALGQTHLNLSIDLIGGAPYQSGALFSFANNTQEITLRVGVSFVSADQACANAESEVGTTGFEEIIAQSKALWQEKLSRIEIDVAGTPPNVTEMLYSSLYRSFLTPVGFILVRRCSSCHTLYPRTMLLEKHKGRLRIRLHLISILCTAGE